MNGHSLVVSLDAAIATIQNMIDTIIAQTPNLIIGSLVVVLTMLSAGHVQRHVEAAAARAGLAGGAGIVFGRLARSLLVLGGLLVALTIVIPSFTPTHLLGAVGFGSVAVGFAARDILQNFLAGLLLLIQEPFQLGDEIEVDKYEGTVERIETRATVIRALDGRRVIIPNADLFTSAVIVNTANATRRSECEISIVGGSDLGRARRCILEAVTAVDGVLSEPPADVISVSLAESAVILRARWWIDPKRSSATAVQDLVIAAIDRAVIANAIEVSSPELTVHLVDHTRRLGSNGSAA